MNAHMKALFLLSLMLWTPMRGLSNAPSPIPATDTEAIRRKQGETAVVEGVVHSAFWVRNQVLMITFQEERGGFVAVSFARNREALDGAFGGDLAGAVAGKRIQVTGGVTEHNYRPQIVVESAEQLKILD